MTHIPVLLDEVMNATNGLSVKRIFDGTFGRGGHLLSLMTKYPTAQVVAFDRDLEAIDFGQIKFVDQLKGGGLTLVHQDYRNFNQKDWGTFDFMLLDLGVSSPQLDMSHRGFSFYHEGPLDMRMDTSEGETAADILNERSEEELNHLFQELGEIRRPYRVVRALVHDRKEKPWQSTRLLAELIERVDGWRVKGHHPATQYFMALRMAVNTELEGVQQGIRRCISGLTDGGRLAVITFHSLEDRIVKQIFKGEVTGFCVNKKVLQAGEDELKMNPRARSAKLRIFQKGIFIKP
jgi:16S rRNA (cytosine1402-N4)-methyltransferase